MVKSDATALLSYDTTFNIGDFYVSILVFRQVLFQGGVTIPAAFIIHDRKCSDVHDRFWRKLIQLVPNLKKNCPVIVTDRESALSNAIKSYITTFAETLNNGYEHMTAKPMTCQFILPTLLHYCKLRISTHSRLCKTP